MGPSLSIILIFCKQLSLGHSASVETKSSGVSGGFPPCEGAHGERQDTKRSYWTAPVEKRISRSDFCPA